MEKNTSHFWVAAWRNERKSITGHELSNKLFEPYQVKSNSSSHLWSSRVTQVNSGESTCSYSWVSFIVLLPFISMTSTASTNHSHKARFCQQSTNVILQLLQIFQIKLMCCTVVITFQALAVAGSDTCMIGFSLLIHSNIFLSSFRTVLLVKLL